MTLDEAIKHAEEVAESQEYEGKKLEESGEKYHDEYENYCASQCFECADEHRQLAEWLKELKVYKEQKPCEDCISREKAKQFLYERLDRLNDNELYDIFSRIIDDMYNELPSVTPARPVGKWQIDDLGTPKCPFCNYMGFGNYCNECGADLREVSEDE